MLKQKLLLLVLLALFSNLKGFSQEKIQDTKNDSQEVIVQRIKKLDAAVKEAEKIATIRKNANSLSISYAVSLEKLSHLQKERLIYLRKQDTNFLLKNNKRQELYEASREAAIKYENTLREALDVYSKFNNGESLAAATLKIELALLTDILPIGFPSEEKQKELFAEREKLFTQALEIQEKLSGNESDITLNTILLLGNFYLKYVEFEKALELYERYLNIGEKKYGINNRNLVPALRGIGIILAKTDREAEADNIALRVSSITGKAEKYFASNVNLIGRATKIQKLFYAELFISDPVNDNGLTSLARAETSASKVRINKSFKKIVVNILVDENGNVIETKILGETKKTKEIEEAARATKFRPFIYKNVAGKMRGSIIYNFVE